MNRNGKKQRKGNKEEDGQGQQKNGEDEREQKENEMSEDHEMEKTHSADLQPLQFAEKVKSAAQEPPISGIVNKVVEGEDCYHFIYKNSSTKGNTVNSGDSSNDAACNGSM